LRPSKDAIQKLGFIRLKGNNGDNTRSIDGEKNLICIDHQVIIDSTHLQQLGQATSTNDSRKCIQEKGTKKQGFHDKLNQQGKRANKKLSKLSKSK
jgi:hypothetical protein